MKLLAGLEVTTKNVERTAEAIGVDMAAREQQQTQGALQLDLPLILGEAVPVLYVQMDGTGIPVVKEETEGRPGKTDGQPAHTRQVKLGCVFTQTTGDEEDYPICDPDSTPYVGAIETAAEFGQRLYLEAWKRGWSRAPKKVVLGDGSEWIWSQAQEHFPGAPQIVATSIMRGNISGAWLASCTRTMRAARTVGCSCTKTCSTRGKIEKPVSSPRSTETSRAVLADKIQTEAEYFDKNAGRMRYPEFRCQHLFVGTGVIEAGCKTVIGSRCKQSGIFWTVRGANAILALRCCPFNGRFEDYWEARRA